MSSDISKQLTETLSKRIMLLDGAMGTMIQRHNLVEDDFRGDHFHNHPLPLKGDNDLLSITRPEIIEGIHSDYFEAGSDFATTNSFNGTTIAQADYQLEDHVYDINFHAARCARRAADEWSDRTPDQPRYVIGSLGPTNRTASISPDVEDPGKRLVSFDDLRTAYKQACSALLEGGADLLMIETVFDTLNAKAAIFGAKEAMQMQGRTAPLMVSGTITDASGRTLSGQTIEAFYVSMMHGQLFSIGLNCSTGARDMLPYIKRLDKVSTLLTTAHPNAGLPNEFGEYDQTPEEMVAELEPFVAGGHINILGGCCGSTPAHMAALRQLADRYPPRKLNDKDQAA